LVHPLPPFVDDFPQSLATAPHAHIPGETVMQKYGLTAEAVAEEARALVDG
jgi:hypothetical protein